MYLWATQYLPETSQGLADGDGFQIHSILYDGGWLTNDDCGWLAHGGQVGALAS